MADISTIERSFVLGSDGVTYFEVTKTTYDDETYDETSRLVGPASQVTNDYADKIEGLALEMSQTARQAYFNNKRLAEVDADNTEIAGFTGTEPKDVIQARYQDLLLTPGWTIDTGSGPVSLVFTINAQNNLRYSIDGGATQAAEYLRGVLRLNNYPTNGVITVFYANARFTRYGNLPNGDIMINTP